MATLMVAVSRGASGILDLVRRQALVAEDAMRAYAETQDDHPALPALESEATRLRHEIERLLMSAFSLPMDREDVNKLCIAVDDAISSIASSARQRPALEGSGIGGRLSKLGEMLIDCTRATVDAMDAINENHLTRAGDHARELRALTRDVRLAYEAALASLVAADLDGLQLTRHALALEDVNRINLRYASVGRLVGVLAVKYS